MKVRFILHMKRYRIQSLILGLNHLTSSESFVVFVGKRLMIQIRWNVKVEDFV